MKKFNLIILALIVVLVLGVFVGCSKENNTGIIEDTNLSSTKENITIKGIADLVPHSELIEFVAPKLEEQGIIVELVATAADNTTNEKLAKGEIDFNFFQHEPYLKEWNNANGYNLVNAGDIHVEPITAYSDKYITIEEIPDNAVVAI